MEVQDKIIWTGWKETNRTKNKMSKWCFHLPEVNMLTAGLKQPLWASAQSGCSKRQKQRQRQRKGPTQPKEIPVNTIL